MKKKLLLFRAPVKSISGYGSHSRDLLFSLYKMNLFDIKIDSCVWGHTPLTALEEQTEFNKWILDNIVTQMSIKPDIYVQVTVPNEFRPLGNYNVGITAGIETTAIPKDWIDGCNRMDLIITTSNFSKEIIEKTYYNEIDNSTKQIINTHRVNKPVEVLFEGVKTDIYNKNKSDFELNIKENFSFLFVGHWLRGVLGQDRKDVGMLIKTFAHTFRDDSNKPALILKTSSATFSIKDREIIKNKIRSIVGEYKNPPSIYLLFGELLETELNGLYNHEKIKAMVSFTKGEGFGRPLLEFTMTGKPVIASNWSGHKDFLSEDKSILLKGSINNVHDSVVDNFIIKDSKWFTVDYDDASVRLRDVFNNYEQHVSKSNLLMNENRENFSIDKMTDRFRNLLKSAIETPIFTKINLPKLTKVS